MDEINKTNLSEQTKFRFDKINKTENYFIEEINQRKSCSQKLNKYITILDYIGKILVISFTSAIGAPVGIGSASFASVFSLKTG